MMIFFRNDSWVHRLIRNVKEVVVNHTYSDLHEQEQHCTKNSCAVAEGGMSSPPPPAMRLVRVEVSCGWLMGRIRGAKVHP